MAKKKTKYRYRSRPKKKKTYRRRKPMGLLGKAGVVTAGGLPVAFAGMDGMSEGWRIFKSGDYSPLEALKCGAANFVDSLTCGFFGLKVFGTVHLNRLDGTGIDYNTNVSAPPTGWLYTTLVGAGLVVLDRLFGQWLMKKASRSVAGFRMLSG